jgi:hypothetical protein
MQIYHLELSSRMNDRKVKLSFNFHVRVDKLHHFNQSFQRKAKHNRQKYYGENCTHYSFVLSLAFLKLQKNRCSKNVQICEAVYNTSKFPL